MKSILISVFAFLLLFSPCTSNSQTLVSATEMGVLPAVLITFFGITDAEYNVRYYKVTYNTTDLNNMPTVASGLIAVPMDPDCDSIPIALYAHGSALLKTFVPSRDSIEANLGKSIASRGYVVAMPDYLGLGDSPGFHTYQHWETEATSSIDILRATKEFIQDSLPFDFSNEIFLTGYSQGGHAAMATAKYIQDNQLESEFNIAGLAPMSGAYHISKRQTDEIILDLPFNFPGYVVYLIMSYENIYSGIYTNNSDFLQAPYDTLIPPLFDGTHSMLEVHPLLPAKASMYLNPNFINSIITDSSTKSTPFWQAMLDNDNYDWTPTYPVNLLYCNSDDLVNPLNTLDAFDAMTANGVTNIEKEDLGNYNHLDCVVPAVSATIDYFQDLRTDCKDPSGLNRLEISYNLNAYPNPVINELHIELENAGSGTIQLFSLEGKLIFSGNMNNTYSISTQQYKSGIYILKVTTATQILMKQITIAH